MNNITLEPVDVCDPFSVFKRMRSFFVETNHNISLLLLYYLREENQVQPVPMKDLTDSLSELKQMGRISFCNNRLFDLNAIDQSGKFQFCGFRQYLTSEQIRIKRRRAAIIRNLTEHQRTLYEWIISYILSNGYYPTQLEIRQRDIIPSNRFSKTLQTLVNYQLIDVLD